MKIERNQYCLRLKNEKAKAVICFVIWLNIFVSSIARVYADSQASNIQHRQISSITSLATSQSEITPSLQQSHSYSQPIVTSNHSNVVKAANISSLTTDKAFANAKITDIATKSLPPLPPGEEIYDLRPFYLVPFPWLETLVRWGTLIFLAWLIWRLIRWWLAPIPRLPKPPRPIDHLQEALRSLDRLRASPIWEPSRVKDVCEHVALILKVFLKDRFGLGIGAASTSDELIEELRRQRVPISLVNRSSELLQLCDDIRYARGSLGERSLDYLYNQVRELLLRGDWRP